MLAIQQNVAALQTAGSIYMSRLVRQQNGLGMRMIGLPQSSAFHIAAWLMHVQTIQCSSEGTTSSSTCLVEIVA